jgi:hypothetical protein
VPLIIKLPGQRSGAVSGVPAQTIDILPSIATLLNIEPSWETGGLSLFGPVDPDRQRFVRTPDRVSLDEYPESQHRALRRKLRLFGDGSLAQLYGFGPHPELVGFRVASPKPGSAVGKVHGLDTERFMDIDPDGGRMPAYVEGRVEWAEAADWDDPPAIAISINGTVGATARTTAHAISTGNPLPADVETSRQSGHFLARIPPQALQSGANDVAVFAVRGGSQPGSWVLQVLEHD